MGIKHQAVLVKKDIEQNIIGLVVVGLYGYDSESGPTLWIRELVVDKKTSRQGYWTKTII